MLWDFIKSFFSGGKTISFEIDDWHKWHKEPVEFHNAVVEHLEKKGYVVETISIAKASTGEKISTLYINCEKYELSIYNSFVDTTQSVFLKKID